MAITTSSTTTTPANQQESSKKDDDNDAVRYLHNLYYNEITFLRSKQDLLRDILDRASNPDTILKAEVQLENTKKSLERLEALQETVALIEEFDIIKKESNNYQTLLL